ncbi:MAG: YbbR-like domain-containing protein [Saprospiraceae bacterium]|nr:YbbR-like domain-containing protein [Saprospiraceae bacterium]MBP7679671.1 YbbR-like domain-containing protein [Saprospiraceae bacterium]
MQKVKFDIASYLKNDRALLFICIGVAVLFWLSAKLSRSYVVEQPIAITYILPLQKALTQPLPKKINCTLEGVGWRLAWQRWMSPNTISIQLDNVPAQTLSRTAIKRKIADNVFPQVFVRDVEYDFIQIKLEDELTRKVPVVLNSALTFKTGYYLSQAPTLKPDSIYITGPASLVQHINTWQTMPLAVSNLKTTTTYTLVLQPCNDEQVILSKTSIDVTLPIEQFTEKMLVLPVTVTNATTGHLRVVPEQIQLSCQVSLSKYQQVRPEDFCIELDASTIDTINIYTQQTIPVAIRKQPEYIKDVAIYPSEVFVKMSN